MVAKRNRTSLILAPWIFTIGFFLIWEAGVRMFNVSTFVLPAPSVIADALWTYRTQLLFHSWHTLWMTIAGFGLAVVFGLLLGMALGASRIINAGSYPLLIGFNAIPSSKPKTTASPKPAIVIQSVCQEWNRSCVR
jgi:NitT/TauT family transport system permease protein